MVASIPWRELQSTDDPSALTVLDPMVGSGTTAVVARALGYKAIGFDADPLAILIAKVWSSDFPTDHAILKRAEQLIDRVADWQSVKQKDAYPIGADSESREFVRYWFDPKSRRQLTALSRAISRVQDDSLRMIYWCAFSRLIVVKQSGASLAMDVSHSRPHRSYKRAPLMPKKGYLPALQRILKAAPFRTDQESRENPKATIRLGDARDLPIKDASVDVVITSPPYLNAIDYMRGHKLSLVWMKHSIDELREIRATSIGNERKSSRTADSSVSAAVNAAARDLNEMPPALKNAFSSYVHDMRDVLAETVRVLKPSGRAVFVVGDCVSKGFSLKNSVAIESLAASVGLTLQKRRFRPLNENRRYLPPPQHIESGVELSKRMRREVILTFGRP